MEEPIAITKLNDFIFCPISIYFHDLYGSTNDILMKSEYQINGTNAHKAIDNGNYSTRKDVLMAIDIYSDKYNLIGKIDVFDLKAKELIERKNKIIKIYDGYVFQIYAQYFCLIEMGFEIDKLSFYSSIDNKKYDVKLPKDDLEMFNKFETLLKMISEFDFNNFEQKNKNKCEKCIYEPACDRGL